MSQAERAEAILSAAAKAGVTPHSNRVADGVQYIAFALELQGRATFEVAEDGHVWLTHDYQRGGPVGHDAWWQDLAGVMGRIRACTEGLKRADS